MGSNVQVAESTQAADSIAKAKVAAATLRSEDGAVSCDECGVNLSNLNSLSSHKSRTCKATKANSTAVAQHTTADDAARIAGGTRVEVQARCTCWA